MKQYLKCKKEWLQVSRIIQVLCDKGFQTVLAGGACRDALLKKVPKDLDIATSALPKNILQLFSSAKMQFEKYACVRVPLATSQYVDITSFRRDGLYLDGRKPESVSYGTIQEDAQRRDFTINALFYQIQQDKILDFTGGLQDLKNTLLKSIGPAKTRFHEDHLRVLRAVRLAHQLNFFIDKDIEEQLPAFSKKIQSLSRTRVFCEFTKMLQAGKIGSGIKSLQKYQLFFSLFPSLESYFKTKNTCSWFLFWDKKFSFYDDVAFCWTVFVLPIFGFDTLAVNSFLKSQGLTKQDIKKSLLYLQTVQKLMDPLVSFAQKLQALEGHKQVVFELAYYFLQSQNKDASFLKLLVCEFDKLACKGKLQALVKAKDLMQHYPQVATQRFSYLLQQALEYQIQHPQATKYDILNLLQNKI